MWEFTLIYNKEKACYIDFIYSKLESQVKFVNGIIIKQNFAGRARISIAVPKKQKDYFVLLLLELVSEVITQDFKYEFLDNNLGLTISNQLTKVAFVKALTVFDKQTDKDLIKKQLIFETELNIDSFYYFKLDELRKRWQEICLLVRDNIGTLQATDSLGDLLKFLIKTSEINFDEVHVYKKNQNYVITDKLNQPINIISSINHGHNQECTLEDLIALSPAKIILHDEKNTNEPFFDYIFNLFDDKVSFKFSNIENIL